MAKIIYKKGFENQNKLECIEGIEIEMLNGQNALIYPKYADLPVLDWDKFDDWKAKFMTEFEALTVKDSAEETDELLELGSPAAKFVRQFRSDIYGHFNMPTLLAAMEIMRQLKEINELARISDGADLLEEDVKVSSCSRFRRELGLVANSFGFAYYSGLAGLYTCVPLVLYRKP